MITDKDIENKRNEVRMLRLQISEIDARRTINDLKRETAVQDGNTWTLCFDTNQNETTIDGVDVELKGAKAVIENQVKAIDELNSQLVVSKCVVADQLKVIERKRDVIKTLQAGMESADANMGNMVSVIGGLRQQVTNQICVIEHKHDFVDELRRKLSRAHGITCEQETTIGELHDHVDELDCGISEQRKIAMGYKELNVLQHGKLEEIKSVINDRCVYTPNHAIINEIRAIIQEE